MFVLAGVALTLGLMRYAELAAAGRLEDSDLVAFGVFYHHKLADAWDLGRFAEDLPFCLRDLLHAFGEVLYGNDEMRHGARLAALEKAAVDCTLFRMHHFLINRRGRGQEIVAHVYSELCHVPAEGGLIKFLRPLLVDCRHFEMYDGVHGYCGYRVKKSV